MSNGTDPNTNFGKADGVSLKAYFDEKSELLAKSFCEKIKDLEEKITDKITANHDLYMTKFTDSKEAVANAFDSSQTAITKSETNQEKRNDAVYVSIVDLQKALSEVVSRQEFTLSNKNSDERYEIVKKNVGDIQLTQSDFLTMEAYEKRHIELQNQVNDMKTLIANIVGKGQGANAFYGYIVGGLGIVIAIITLVLKLNAI